MLNSKNILLVDIDERFINMMDQYLGREGFSVHIARDAYTAQALVKQMHVHVALVSVSLLNHHDNNDLSGIQLAINLAPYTRVIMSAKAPTFEMVRQALAPRLNGPAPAYEFIRKEEGIAPILTVIHKVMNLAVDVTTSQLQRSGRVLAVEPHQMISHHPRSSSSFVLDMNTRVAVVNGESIPLTEREFRIIAYFMDRPETVITREDIVNKILQEIYDPIADCNRVNNIISRLRKKIEPDIDQPRFVVTRWGSGWMFYPEGDAPHIF